MNAHQVTRSNTDYKTTLYICGCPDYTRNGGSYMFYDFTSGKTYVGCKHMHALYIEQAKTFVAQAQLQKAENERLGGTVTKTAKSLLKT